MCVATLWLRSHVFVARPINRITMTNWEGTDVVPDFSVPASEALAIARRLISEKAKP
jgi:hypothetical protein